MLGSRARAASIASSAAARSLQQALITKARARGAARGRARPQLTLPPQPLDFKLSFTNPADHAVDAPLLDAVKVAEASAFGLQASAIGQRGGGAWAFADLAVSATYSVPGLTGAEYLALQSAVPACTGAFATGAAAVSGTGQTFTVNVTNVGAAAPTATMAQALLLWQALSLNVSAYPAAAALNGCLQAALAPQSVATPAPRPAVSVLMTTTVTYPASTAVSGVYPGAGCLDGPLTPYSLQSLTTFCFNGAGPSPPALPPGNNTPPAAPYSNKLPDTQDVPAATLLALEICVGLAGGLLIFCLVALYFQLRRRQRAAAAVAWVKDKQQLELADLAPQESTRIEGLLDMLEKDDEQRELRNKAAFEKKQAELLAAAAAARAAEAERARSAAEAEQAAAMEAEMRRRGYYPGGRGGRGGRIPAPGGRGRGPPMPPPGRGGYNRAGSLNDDMRAIQGPGTFAPVSPGGRGPGGGGRPSPVPYGGARR